VRALFDVNVLLALFDRQHVHHGRAAGWWKTWRSEGWASCPLTENGFVRVISGASYANPIPIRQAMRILDDQIMLGGHAFWPDDISISDAAAFDDAYILRPGQITDVYLLALAVKNSGCLVTFDKSIPLAAVRGAEPRHLVVPA
jgi:toxin-antitoxin system PIN domain toxin